jgi:hypothetical protein
MRTRGDILRVDDPGVVKLQLLSGTAELKPWTLAQLEESKVGLQRCVLGRPHRWWWK